MGTIIILSQFILALAILVTLHELGHFIAARIFGIRVEKFYLFFDAFGFKLFKFKKGDTEYGVGWLPLGGYVKISGMIDESLDTKQMATEPEPWEFRSKPAWQRLIVMVGGVTVNLILGIGIMVMLLWVNGKEYVPNKAVNANGGYYFSPEARKLGFKTGDQIVSINGHEFEDVSDEMIALFSSKKREIQIHRGDKDTTVILPDNFEEMGGKKSDLPFFGIRNRFEIRTVMAGSAASKAGIKKGDKFVSIDGQDARIYWEFRELMMSKKDKKVKLVIERENKNVELDATISSAGTLGMDVKPIGLKEISKKVDYSFGAAVNQGTGEAFGTLGANISALKKVVTGKLDAKKSVAGPIGIAQMFGPEWDWVKFWLLTSTLSLVLAFMNILPIPALDGGHVMFLLWEIVTGRPVNQKVLYVGQLIGMLLLAALFVFIFWVDISRALGF